MEKIIRKQEQLLTALKHLEESTVRLDHIKNKEFKVSDLTKKETSEILRESNIQRFEFCVDLFWKYLKLYLEKEFLIEAELAGPRWVIRVACDEKLISEKDAEAFLEMMMDHNETSHGYIEEVADKISHRAARYHKLMYHYAQKLAPLPAN